MNDRETIIRVLKEIANDKRMLNHADYWALICAEAAELLKAQEPVKPTINEYGEAYCICGENVGIIPSSKNLPSIRSKYCSECGRRMKWE